MMDVREKLVELIGSTEYGNGSLVGNNFQKGFIEKIATHLIANGVTVQENVEISDELLKQLKNAPITICKEEPSIELVQEWISVDEKLPQNFISVLGYMTDAGEFPPVRHGRWIEHEKYDFGTMYDCSICGDRILDNGHSWNYCPNCGARMDGGTN